MKLGTCCIITSGGVVSKGETKYPSINGYNLGRVTKATLEKPNGQSLLAKKVKSNLDALYKCLQYIGSRPEQERMFRVGSDLLPWFDSEYNYMYDDALMFIIEHKLKRCRELIQRNNIRIVTHPDQYIIVDSLREDVRLKSIECLKYHKFFMERLTTVAEGGCINVHLHGKLGELPEIDAIREAGLVEWVTFENSDKGLSGHEYTLSMCERYGFRYVFDIHHYACLEGGRIEFNSPEMSRILATWTGKSRPKMHVSQSRENHDNIRAHSDFITDPSIIDYVRELLTVSDFSVEAKAKQLAVQQLAAKINL